MKTSARYLAITALALLGASPELLAATNIYRSVGNRATALATGTGNSLTISGSTATFASALADNIGVGDALQYDSDGNGSIDAIAFIYGRTSSTEYTVRNSLGAVPTAVAGDLDWSLYRAYRGLAAMGVGTENASIDDAVENFDTSTIGRDLVTNDEIWIAACYGDAADTVSAQINLNSGWITDATRYMRIYTPYLPTEVGASQRHNGVWDTSKYYIEVTATNPADNFTLDLNQLAYVRIDGLQIYRNHNSLVGSAVVRYFSNLVGGEMQLSNSILRSRTGGTGIGLNLSVSETASFKVWNNIIYGAADRGISETSYRAAGGPGGVAYIYNNTIVGSAIGFFVRGTNGDGHPVIAKNNIVQGATLHGFDGTNSAPAWGGNFAAGSTYNLSNMADAPGTNAQNSKTVTFRNAAADDYRLASGDTVAQNMGIDLSADANIAFSTDIQNESRSAWDIGADEYVNPDILFISSFVSSGITISGFNARISYSGDANADGACTFYYCNNTDSAGCNPTAGTSVAMTRGSSTYTASVSGLVNPNNPGDVFNVRVACTDADTVVGSPIVTTVALSSGTADTISASSLSTSGVTMTAFNASMNFTGDANASAVCTLYYCDNTASPGCSALAGSTIVMTRGAGVLTAAISGLSNRNPGHQYNLRTNCVDADGASGDLTATVTLVTDNIAPKAPLPLIIQ